jgi:hypothetical protein
MDLGKDAGRLLDQLDVLRHSSDLDLLVFFARHPRTLLSSEQIAAFLGYGVKEIAASLELLLEAGFLTRTPHPRHVARMYLLVVDPPGGGWLPALKRLATTREGRLAVIWEIRRRSSGALRQPTQRGAIADTAVSRPLQFPQPAPAIDASQRKRGKPSTGASSAQEKKSGRGGER